MSLSGTGLGVWGPSPPRPVQAVQRRANVELPLFEYNPFGLSDLEHVTLTLAVLYSSNE